MLSILTLQIYELRKTIMPGKNDKVEGCLRLSTMVIFLKKAGADTSLGNSPADISRLNPRRYTLIFLSAKICVHLNPRFLRGRFCED